MEENSHEHAIKHGIHFQHQFFKNIEKTCKVGTLGRPFGHCLDNAPWQMEASGAQILHAPIYKFILARSISHFFEIPLWILRSRNSLHFPLGLRWGGSGCSLAVPWMKESASHHWKIRNQEKHGNNIEICMRTALGSKTSRKLHFPGQMAAEIRQWAAQWMYSAPESNVLPTN